MSDPIDSNDSPPDEPKPNAAGYICPPDAGPAWRAAAEMGIDMSLIEIALTKTPWERMQDHDEALAFAMQLQRAVEEQNGKTRQNGGETR